MAQGWIKLHRDIQYNDIWKEKPFSRGQAWVDLLLMANYEDRNVLFDGRYIEVNRGSFITSELKLMDRWGWSKSKVRLFLEQLEEQQMIIKKADQKKTTLTLTNYSVWQDLDTTERPLKDYSKTTERLLKDTNKKDKNTYTSTDNKRTDLIQFADKIFLTIEQYNTFCEKCGKGIRYLHYFVKLQKQKADGYKPPGSDYEELLKIYSEENGTG
jgi:hypothetical protein